MPLVKSIHPIVSIFRSWATRSISDQTCRDTSQRFDATGRDSTVADSPSESKVSEAAGRTQIVGLEPIARALPGDRTFQFQLQRLPTGFTDNPWEPLKALCAPSRAKCLLFSQRPNEKGASVPFLAQRRVYGESRRFDSVSYAFVSEEKRN